MPNRVIRDDILTSDRVNLLSPVEEVFYRRLMSIVDDFGRCDTRPILLIARCFPLRPDSVTVDDINQWLVALDKAELIAWYEDNECSYLEILRFGQAVRRRDSEFPAPPDTQEYIERFIPSHVRRLVLSIGHCEVCGSTEFLSIDHKVPVTRGGKGNIENLRCLCRSCNSKKGTRLVSEMMA